MSSKQEISLEYASLRLPGHCPLGIWVIPCPNDTHTWSGVLFVHRGYYAGGIFRFEIKFSPHYPYGGDSRSRVESRKSRTNERDNRQDGSVPRIYFKSDCFHPLINQQDGFFDSTSRFKTWRPHQDFVFHLLHFLKSSFKRSGLEKIISSPEDESTAQNMAAFKAYRDQTQVFANLASQSATLSCSPSSLYKQTSSSNGNSNHSDRDSDDNNYKLIKFSPLNDQEWREVRSRMVPALSTSGNSSKQPFDQIKEE
ncbi:hypothetical protein BY996DRAFT_6964520 [Phakopsora pachyrhizi]|uniref:UBC core domain-containing protein n=1 Tax=Phakopsora pachyrhizi TaxID=170000 RepID=A0AAV0AXD1_PHAPC|nr:hypothetical protein BY996DRAFT_6964520 [Phakopsora pachyrhizi]CAH7672655.1 hypothetical protein PPACK8108_LOCUS7472 [Phakopsora pachyrhizi]